MLVPAAWEGGHVEDPPSSPSTATTRRSIRAVGRSGGAGLHGRHRGRSGDGSQRPAPDAVCLVCRWARGVRERGGSGRPSGARRRASGSSRPRRHALGRSPRRVGCRPTHCGRSPGAVPTADGSRPGGRSGPILDRAAVPIAEPELRRRQVALGYTREELSVVVRSAAASGVEPTFSMGDDTPIAVLSASDRPLHHHLRQRFAQVTNPAIDHVRGTVGDLAP